VESDSGGFQREIELLIALGRAGVRYVLIGRQACILHGLPVHSFDYDFWVHPDPANLDALLREADALGLVPSVDRDRMRSVPFFHLENDTKVDVWKVREFLLATGERIEFDEVHARRMDLRDEEKGLVIPIPAIEDLILLKRLGKRPKDEEDIKGLQAILEQRRRPQGS